MAFKVSCTAIGVLLIAAFLLGCADVPSTGPEVKDQRSLYRFINAAPDVANATVSVENAPVGTVAYQAATSYVDLPAGRKVALSSAALIRSGRLWTVTKRNGGHSAQNRSNARVYKCSRAPHV
jgi:hypothetical protein